MHSSVPITMFFLGVVLLVTWSELVPNVAGYGVQGVCQYLSSRTSRYPVNTAPFELVTRSHKQYVARGRPIEGKLINIVDD